MGRRNTAGKAVAVASLLAPGVSVPSQAEALKVVSAGAAPKMATEQIVVHSTSLNRDMVIEITRPFAPVPSGRKVAAVYLLDGGYDFAGQEGWMLGGAGGMASA